MNPMNVEHTPPIIALLTGIDDLMVRLNEVQTENNKYAGSEQYHGIYVVLIADNSIQNNMPPMANEAMPMIPEIKDNKIILR